jgi:hypothetical protein
MSDFRSSRRRKKIARKNPPRGEEPREDQAADAITVAWTASVTAVFLADLATVAAHFYSLGDPESKTAPAFEAIMLLTACVMGVVALALLPVVWHVRRLKPPWSFIVFAILVAAAPIATTISRIAPP